MSPCSVSKPRSITCEQLLLDDGSVFSRQSTVVQESAAAGLTTGELCRRYLDHIRSCTLTLIRPVSTPDGVEFRLRWLGIRLLRFHLPETSPDGSVSTLRIRGGLLVQPLRRNYGQMSFSVEPALCSFKVSLQLSNYYPLLLGSPKPSPGHYWLYRLTQALIHRRVTIRFLERLHRHPAGFCARTQVVETSERQGRPV